MHFRVYFHSEIPSCVSTDPSHSSFFHSPHHPCYLCSWCAADLRESDRTAGYVWVYFHAILVGETWPAFQSLVPDGGSNLRGKGGEKRKQA